MIDNVIKIFLFCSVPALIDYWVYRATGVPLDQSIWWWLRNFGEAPRLVLAFGILTGLTFAGGAYGLSKDFYQGLISHPQTALFLGYHDLQEHYRLDDGGQTQVAVNYPGPGEFRLDRVYQPATLMYNPLSQLHWPLKETGGAGLSVALAAGALLFALVTLGYAHVLYLDKYMPEVLVGVQPGQLHEQELVPYFMKSMFSYATSNPLPFVLLAAAVASGIALQSHRLKSESGRLTARQVPTAVKPGAMLTATLVDTYSQHVVLNEKPRVDDTSGTSKDLYRYYAIFEIAELYPHTVWVSSYLGSDLPTDKDDGVYSSLDDELERRTGYENAKSLADRLEQMKASRPRMKAKVTENMTLDWTVEPSLALYDAGSSPPRKAASAR